MILHNPIIFVVPCVDIIIIYILNSFTMAPHLSLQSWLFLTWLEQPTFMTTIKIQFHFVTIVSNRFLPSTLSKFARCSSHLALKFQQPPSCVIVIFWTKISNFPNFGWCLIFSFCFSSMLTLLLHHWVLLHFFHQLQWQINGRFYMFFLVLFSCFQNQETCLVNFYCSRKLNIEKVIIFHDVLSNLSNIVFILFVCKD